MMWINGEWDPFFVQPAKFTIMCRIMSNARREEARGGNCAGELRREETCRGEAGHLRDGKRQT